MVRGKTIAGLAGLLVSLSACGADYTTGPKNIDTSNGGYEAPQRIQGQETSEKERNESRHTADIPDVSYNDEVKERLERVRKMYGDLVIDPVVKEGMLTGVNIAARVYGAGDSMMYGWAEYIATGEEPKIPYRLEGFDGQPLDLSNLTGIKADSTSTGN